MTWSEMMRDEYGYTTQTTFWEDFTIADHFGISAVRDTFKRAFEAWKSDYIYLTELVMVLNHKIWYWHGQHGRRDMMQFVDTYQELWEKADAWACENLKGDELTYFYRTLD